MLKGSGSPSLEVVGMTLVKTRPVEDCCKGYTKSNSADRCIAVCSEDCLHGSCIAPDTCQCETGYGGPTCNIWTRNPSYSQGGKKWVATIQYILDRAKHAHLDDPSLEKRNKQLLKERVHLHMHILSLINGTRGEDISEQPGPSVRKMWDTRKTGLQRGEGVSRGNLTIFTSRRRDWNLQQQQQQPKTGDQYRGHGLTLYENCKKWHHTLNWRRIEISQYKERHQEEQQININKPHISNWRREISQYKETHQEEQQININKPFLPDKYGPTSRIDQGHVREKFKHCTQQGTFTRDTANRGRWYQTPPKNKNKPHG
uniref:EGF-like domain-containing protein n=1 Tax=Timema genevievae TaxID=629358 RepID=A0A7R9K7I9_TIMGE|nr:unnamed protein product [Timema genevievae]